ncbi:MAG TPA: hypothetical protein VGK87_04220 [Anaerolineae bacterium]|jgi:hypothetical protein
MTTTLTANEIADAIVREWVTGHHVEIRRITEAQARSMAWRLVLLTEFPISRAHSYISAALRRYRLKHPHS